jgi:hypothetical protein
MILFLKRKSKLIINLMLIALIAYGVGRLYFQLTAGFTEGNIRTDLSLEPDHGIPLLAMSEMNSLQAILDQPYRYLGKGCQSYVFLSDDHQYVLKFLKYQRFRPQFYLEALSFIPSIDKRLQKKTVEKRTKLDALLESWKIAYGDLKDETGIVYLHLNRGDKFQSPIAIVDKLGLKHTVDPDEVVFLVQKKADMLCPEIAKRMKANELEPSKKLIGNLVTMLLSEYGRGLGDNDHALMQNTGVVGDQPLHIDVGQFSKEARFQSPDVYKHELFSKTYKFRIWLSKHFPELERYLTGLLLEVIGPEMSSMKTSFKTVDEGA